MVSASVPAKPWFESARWLTGTELARAASIRELHRNPRLIEQLRPVLAQAQGLPLNRFELALDVISALQLKALIPDLIARSRVDPTGLSYLALNTLSDDYAGLRTLYAARLEAAPLAAKVILIDSLARLHAPISLKQLRALLAEGNEVQEAALAYVRDAALRWGEDRYLSTVAQTLGCYANERRIQALLIAAELPAERRGPFSIVRVWCPGAIPDAIRPWCLIR